jgi:DNA-binding transcriptional LysR family regulator
MDPDIALFVAVVNSGSLSAAGRAVGISPAMVSKRIARLEARLGVRLLVRTTRRLDLTGPGERFHTDAVAILATLAEAEARVSGRGGTPAGRLRVAAPTSFGRMLIAPHLAGFLDRYSAVELEMDLSDAMIDIAAERVDLAIRIARAVRQPGLSFGSWRTEDTGRSGAASPARDRRSAAVAAVRTGQGGDRGSAQPRADEQQRPDPRTGAGRRRRRAAVAMGRAWCARGGRLGAGVAGL